MTKNARFWTYLGYQGFVKITLRPGQEITWYIFNYTEEGWSSTKETFRHCGEHVECEVASEGRDCDGRHGDYATHYCELEQLNQGGERTTGWSEGPLFVNVPAWEYGERSQYDQYAEQMGY